MREATLNHHGVTYETLQYYSDALHAFRHRYGHKLKVRAKVDPSDLGAIHVFEPKEKFWIRVEANDQAYARGLSLHRHHLNLKYAREQYRREDEQALQSAQWELQQLIADALPMALSIRANALIARTFGIGTQHIFNNLGTDGNLGPLTGPFASQPLNPFGQPAPTSVPHTPSPPQPRPVVETVAGAAVSAGMHRPSRQRDIPVYDADLSLGTKQIHGSGGQK